VRVAGGGDAGADIEELPDPGLSREVADDAAEEGPVGPDGEGQLRVDLKPGIDRGPVGREIVLPAETVVVQTRDAAEIVCA
jgi:hypothetical protein